MLLLQLQLHLLLFQSVTVAVTLTPIVLVTLRTITIMSLRSQSNKRTYEELPTDDSDLEIIFEKKDKSNSRSNGSKSNSSNKKKTNSKNISNSNSNSKSSSNSNNIKTSGKKDKSSTKDNDGDSVASVAEELIVEKILGRKLVTTKVVEHSNNANTNTSNDNSYSNSNSYGDSYVPSSETVTVTEELFYIKWKGLSYLHSSWEKREDIEAVDPNGKTKIKRFLQTPQHPRIFGEARPKSSDSDRDSDDDDYSDYEVGDAVDYFNPEFVDIHRVISCDTILTRHAEVKVAVELLEVPSAKVSKSIQAKGSASSNSITNDIDRNADAEDVDPDDEVQYLVKWRGQSYGECTWEKWKDIKEHYEEVFNFWQRERIGKATKKIPRRPNVEEYRALTTSPVYGLIAEDTKEKYLKEKEQTGLLLREYQLEGLNWLLWNWFHKRSCILADEMGLGRRNFM